MTVGQEPSMDLPSAFSSPMEGPCDLAHAILLVREKSGGAMRFVQAGAGEQRCAGRLRQGARHDPQRAAAPPAPGQRPRADASPVDPRSSPDRCRRLSSASKFPFIPGSLQLRLSAQGHTLALLCLSSGPSLSGRPRDYSREAGDHSSAIIVQDAGKLHTTATNIINRPARGEGVWCSMAAANATAGEMQLSLHK